MVNYLPGLINIEDIVEVGSFKEFFVVFHVLNIILFFLVFTKKLYRYNYYILQLYLHTWLKIMSTKNVLQKTIKIVFKLDSLTVFIKSMSYYYNFGFSFTNKMIFN